MKSVKGNQFLLAKDGAGANRLMVFATTDNLKKLVEANTLYVDGTFHTCPRVFYQIFTVHVEQIGWRVPLVYCLLPNKRQETYERVFQLLEQEVLKLGLNLMPIGLRACHYQCSTGHLPSSNRRTMLLSFLLGSDPQIQQLSPIPAEWWCAVICQEGHCLGTCTLAL